MRYGPMKPKGLQVEGREKFYAVVQLRQDNLHGDLYNIVGFQTNLKFPEQKRVFSLIPALHRAEFVRYGVMHRNTFLCSPRILNADFSVKEDKTLFFAGQITGVEGYMESAASGILAGINAVRTLKQQPTLVFPADTMMGALSRYIADPSVRKFQPMGANLGILPELENRPRDKRERAAAYAYRALASQERFIKQHMG